MDCFARVLWGCLMDAAADSNRTSRALHDRLEVLRDAR